MAFGDLVKFDVDPSGVQSSTSMDLGSNPAAGNLLVLLAYGRSDGETASSISPSGMTLLQDADAQFACFCYAKFSDGTEQTAGFNFSNNNDIFGAYIEIDMGGNSSGSLASNDVSVASSVSSIGSGAITPAESTNCLVAIAVAETTAVTGEAADNGFTVILNDSADSAECIVATKINATGSQSTTLSVNESKSLWGMIIDVSFAGGGSPTPPIYEPPRILFRR